MTIFTKKTSLLLGKTPFWSGLCFWLTGLIFCLFAWELNKFFPTHGPIVLGLSSFVNMFCFFQGLNKMRRAGARALTLFRAWRQNLVPGWGWGDAGFMLVDDRQGFFVGNGTLVDFRQITKITCYSTALSHRLQFFLYSKNPLRPLEIGVKDHAALLCAAQRLREAIISYTHKELDVLVIDTLYTADGEQKTHEYPLKKDYDTGIKAL